MSKYFEDYLFPQFLQSLDSCTISEYSNFEIQNQISMLAIKAIADFKFPKVSLEYSFDDTINAATAIAFGYYFTDDKISQREYNVIVARMKQY